MMLKRMRNVPYTIGTATLVVTLLLSACATSVAPALPAESRAPALAEYRLGLGDKVRISVYGERDLSGEYQVGGNGAVTMPLIGNVQAVGLTARELQAALFARFSPKILRNPSISVEVYDFRPFVVLGEVERPGRFPASEGTTLTGAIAAAGGFTYRAEKKRVFIRRPGNPTEYQVDPNDPLIIGPGDVVRVAERHF